MELHRVERGGSRIRRVREANESAILSTKNKRSDASTSRDGKARTLLVLVLRSSSLGGRLRGGIVLCLGDLVAALVGFSLFGVGLHEGRGGGGQLRVGGGDDDGRRGVD